MTTQLQLINIIIIIIIIIIILIFWRISASRSARRKIQQDKSLRVPLMRLPKDVSLLNYSWIHPPNTLSIIVYVTSSRSWPIFDIISKPLPAKPEKTHNHLSRLYCKVFESLRLSCCCVKLIAINTTSKCYIFNLATCFDIRGSSSGTLCFFFTSRFYELD